MTHLAYILSASHSGSTLLAMLLGAHPEICTVGELKASALDDIGRYRCSCGELITRCAFWAKVSDSMARKSFRFDITDAGTDIKSCGGVYARRLLRPLHRGPLLERIRDVSLFLSSTWRTRLPEIQRRNTALMETICEISGAQVLVDSSKSALRLKYLLKNPALDVRVIRLIRDGRGVALSYMDPANYADARDPALRGGGMGGDRENERISVREAAYEWRRSNEEAEHVVAGLDSSRWIKVRYEDLCKWPDETLRRLFTFLKVNPDQKVHDFRRVEHHVLGNGMRLDLTSEIKLDERWKSVLTDQDLQIFESLAGEMNRRYGYQ